MSRPRRRRRSFSRSIGQAYRALRRSMRPDEWGGMPGGQDDERLVEEMAAAIRRIFNKRRKQ